jgi:DNA-3-methyladenine glycosylase
MRLAGIIVEVEAYLGPHDQGSHTRGGRRTPRNESMYLPGGHAYVYFTYGMHYCLNVVCGKREHGSAVLLRAIEPTEGMSAMYLHRPNARTAHDLCSGPGKLAQALAIDRSLDGVDLMTSRSLFVERARSARLSDELISTSARIGLNPNPNYAGNWARRKLRYFIRENSFVSRSRVPVARRRSRES